MASSPSPPVRTDSRGYFAVRAGQHSNFELGLVQHPAHRDYTFPIRLNHEKEIDLQPLTVIHGRVRSIEGPGNSNDPSEGEDAHQAFLLVRFDDHPEEPLRAPVSAAGTFRLETWWFGRAHVELWRDTSTRLLALAPLELEEGEHRELGILEPER